MSTQSGIRKRGPGSSPSASESVPFTISRILVGGGHMSREVHCVEAFDYRRREEEPLLGARPVVSRVSLGLRHGAASSCHVLLDLHGHVAVEGEPSLKAKLLLASRSDQARRQDRLPEHVEVSAANPVDQRLDPCAGNPILSEQMSKNGDAAASLVPLYDRVHVARLIHGDHAARDEGAQGATVCCDLRAASRDRRGARRGARGTGGKASGPPSGPRSRSCLQYGFNRGPVQRTPGPKLLRKLGGLGTHLYATGVEADVYEATLVNSVGARQAARLPEIH